jgi:hypothetical protein
VEEAINKPKGILETELFQGNAENETKRNHNNNIITK